MVAISNINSLNQNKRSILLVFNDIVYLWVFIKLTKNPQLPHWMEKLSLEAIIKIHTERQDS